MEQSASLPAPKIPNPVKQSGVRSLILVLVGLVVGALFTFFLLKSSGANSNSQQKISSTIALPLDATRIVACDDKHGALYVEPQNIPTGPVYMVNNNKVIGLEFMIDKADFDAGKSFTNLAGLGIKVDHVNMTLYPSGHAGMPLPHYMIDFYTISSAKANAIKCAPGSSNTIMNMNEGSGSGMIMKGQ